MTLVLLELLFSEEQSQYSTAANFQKKDLQ